MTRIVLPNTGDLTAFGRDLGTGTALPATGPGASALRRGDVYQHTGLGCLMGYTGTAWRQAEVPTVATVAARDAISTTYSAALYDGFTVWVSDRRTRSTWTGAAWDSVSAMRRWLNLTTVTAANLGITVIPCNATDFTQGTGLTASGGGIAVAAAGLYLVDFSVHFNGGGSGARTGIVRVNGTSVREIGTIGTVTRAGGSWVVPLAALDVVDLAVYVEGGSSVPIGGAAVRDSGIAVTRLGN